MSTPRSWLAALALVVTLATACGSDDDAAPATEPEPVVVTSTTEVPILRGSGRTTDDPGSTVQADGETATGTPPPPTASQSSSSVPPSGDADGDCRALAGLVDGPDAAILGQLAARIDGAEPELPDALRVLADGDANREARLAGASRLGGLLGISCPGIERNSNVTLLGEGLDVATFGQERALVSSAVTNVLGFPTLDTGPIDPLSAFGTCPGTQLWVIEWPDLGLLFSDDGEGPESFEFFGWRSFALDGATTEAPPTTPEGIKIGDQLSDALTTYAADGAIEETDILLDVPLVSVPDRYVFVGDGGGLIDAIEGGTPCAE